MGLQDSECEQSAWEKLEVFGSGSENSSTF